MNNAFSSALERITPGIINAQFIGCMQRAMPFVIFKESVDACNLEQSAHDRH
jgi:hypothetical protein